jgi:hypothetical protein
MSSEAVLISNPQCSHPKMVELMTKRINGHLTATRHARDDITSGITIHCATRGV